jgi:Mg/Co/Ni transporter MgtE
MAYSCEGYIYIGTLGRCSRRPFTASLTNGLVSFMFVYKWHSAMFQKHWHILFCYRGAVTSLISLLSQLTCVMSPLTTFGYDGFPYV